MEEKKESRKFRRAKNVYTRKVVNNYYNVCNTKEPWHMNKQEFRLVWSIICFTFIIIMCKILQNLWPLITLFFWLMIMVEK